jgi:Ca2+-binding RTX toxin-like protein
MPIGQYIISRVDGGLTHAQAVALATAHGGTLAAVTSAEENALITGFLTQDSLLLGHDSHDGATYGPWIGLTQPPGSLEPGGGWVWDTGEIYDYNNWHNGQPDNFIGDSFAIYWSFSQDFRWGDQINDPFSAGFGPVVSAAIEVVASVKSLTGTNGHDLVWGGAVANKIKGLDGDDILSGNGGNDQIDGGSGKDTLDGGSGDDRLTGGKGADVLTGGTGADHFIFLTAKDSPTSAGGRDVITDFKVIEHDIIDLTALDAIAGGADDAFVFHGSAKFTALGQVRVYVSGADTFVDLNLTGDLAPDMRIVLTGHVALDATSFDL